MMEKEKLRKADIFSGAMIFLAGVWIVLQSLKMPMKDSWGGVQNVWFVSPAIFPLFVGGMIMLLGMLLVRTAIKSVGWQGLTDVLRWLVSHELRPFLASAPNTRFFAIVALLISLVYLTIPRIDFFLCSVLFLLVFITMFYLDDDRLLRKMLQFYLLGTLGLTGYFAVGLDPLLNPLVPYLRDWLTMAFIVAYAIHVRRMVQPMVELKKKYRLSLIIAVAAPFVIGTIFKYLLLVPMPAEGLVVTVMDAIRYWDF